MKRGDRTEENKRINPYTLLRNKIIEFIDKLQSRHTVVMWLYPKDKLQSNWKLDDLYQRVTAAEQIGYEVYLKATDDGLRVIYKKEIPLIPYEWRQ